MEEIQGLWVFKLNRVSLLSVASSNWDTVSQFYLMKITVKTLKNETFNFDVDPSKTVQMRHVN